MEHSSIEKSSLVTSIYMARSIRRAQIRCAQCAKLRSFRYRKKVKKERIGKRRVCGEDSTAFVKGGTLHYIGLSVRRQETVENMEVISCHSTSSGCK